MAGATMPGESPAAAAVAQRFRLRRVFLRTLVGSLATCAAVAVGALLLGEFNETTARILGTLAALAVHSGLAMFCAETLERQRWPLLSRAGLGLFALTFTVLMVCIWWPGIDDDDIVRSVLTAAAAIPAFLLAIPSADLLERRLRPWLSGPALAACFLALLMVCLVIWWVEDRVVWFGKATAVVSIAAAALAHTCLLVRVPGGQMLMRVLIGTVVCVAALALQAAAVIIWEIGDEFAFRVLGALGVLAASGSLALVILARLRRVARVEQLVTAAAQVELRCPRCRVLQTVDAGASQCAACGLRLRIEIEEPRCARCNYLLWQLPQRRCPECGTPF